MITHNDKRINPGRMNRWMALVTLVLFLSCSGQNKIQKPIGKDGFITSSSGLKYQILKKGTGETAKAGNEVLIFETNTYLDGTILYSNENTSTPVKVLIGGSQVTDAVGEGLRGMQVGEIRRLIAPPYR